MTKMMKAARRPRLALLAVSVALALAAAACATGPLGSHGTDNLPMWTAGYSGGGGGGGGGGGR